MDGPLDYASFEPGAYYSRLDLTISEVVARHFCFDLAFAPVVPQFRFDLAILDISIFGSGAHHFRADFTILTYTAHQFR